MKILKKASIIAIACAISHGVWAQTDSYGSVLLPGTHIVAGNLRNNEFFIVADNEKPAGHTPANVPHQTSEPKQTTHSINVALDHKKPLDKKA